MLDVPTPTDDERPILVTGATGFIGLEVTRQLAAAGTPVRAMFRRPHRAALLAQLPAELVMADLLSPPTLERAARGCRAVIHCAGRATFEPYERLRPTLVEGTRHVLAAALEAGAERVVFASSLFVHGAAQGPLVDATTPPDPDIGYGRAKVEAERLVHDAGLPGGALSLRLPHVYGPTDLLFAMLRTGWLPWPAEPDSSLPHMHVRDAAAALIAAVDRSDVGPLPVGDDTTVDWETFLAVVTTYQPTARVVRIPPRLATVAGDAVGLLAGRGRFATMAHGDAVRGWNLDLRLAPGSMSALGLDCLYPSVHHGIPASLDAAMPYRWRHPVVDRRGIGRGAPD